ncbi:hypothetical protein Q1695_003946 [Nippostrongylus brasiliensis]|nr:hypothetical protein Q1695_003946 [Nippostrongylus brasiliensis]
MKSLSNKSTDPKSNSKLTVNRPPARTSSLKTPKAAASGGVKRKVAASVRHQNAENVKPAKIDEVDPQSSIEENVIAEERRRRFARGSSEAQLEEILLKVFANPSIEPTDNNLTKKRPSKDSSKPPPSSGTRKSTKTVKMSATQNSVKPAPKPEKTETAKPVKKPEPPKTDSTKKITANTEHKLPEEQDSKHPSAKAKGNSKQDTKVEPGKTSESQKTETHPDDSGNVDAAKMKAPSRQSSSGKVVAVMTDKKVEPQSQKATESTPTVTVEDSTIDKTDAAKAKTTQRQSSVTKLPVGVGEKRTEQSGQKPPATASTIRSEEQAAEKTDQAAKQKAPQKQQSGTKAPTSAGEKRQELPNQKSVEKPSPPQEEAKTETSKPKTSPKHTNKTKAPADDKTQKSLGKKILEKAEHKILQKHQTNDKPKAKSTAKSASPLKSKNPAAAKSEWFIIVILGIAILLT